MPDLDFSKDPKTHPRTLHIHQDEPFNAEPADPAELIKYHITPTYLVYSRNHGPMPNIAREEDYSLSVDGLVERNLTLTLSDLKSMQKTEAVTALQVFS
jgi:DMSO/TMAO reductase YedYZ molybdopterin-dependent catalytic subunit